MTFLGQNMNQQTVTTPHINEIYFLTAPQEAQVYSDSDIFVYEFQRVRILRPILERKTGNINGKRKFRNELAIFNGIDIGRT